MWGQKRKAEIRGKTYNPLTWSEKTNRNFFIKFACLIVGLGTCVVLKVGGQRLPPSLFGLNPWPMGSYFPVPVTHGQWKCQVLTTGPPVLICFVSFSQWKSMIILVPLVLSMTYWLYTHTPTDTHTHTLTHTCTCTHMFLLPSLPLFSNIVFLKVLVKSFPSGYIIIAV